MRIPLRRSLLIFALIVNTLSFQAQLYSIMNFMSDTLLRNNVAANRVSAVRETIKDSALHDNGKYLFDKKGQVIEINTGLVTFSRLKITYNERGQQIKQTRYEVFDTTKVESWKTTKYDLKNRITSYEGGQFYGGQKLEGKFFEISYIKDAKGKQRTVSRSYSDYKPRTVSYGHDSISGTDTFYVSYEHRADDPLKRAGTKKLNHSRTKDGYIYDDEVEYMVHGKTEVAQKLKCRYYLIDKKGHFLEQGEVDYQEAYMDYAQEHPDDFNENYYSPLFIKALMKGKINGLKKPETTWKYDEKGNLLETGQQGYTTSMKYNDKGQVVELQGGGEEFPDKNIVTILYNDKNLPVRVISTSWNANEENQVKEISERLYEYTFY